MTNEAEKFILTLKEHFLWSILTTTDGLRPISRVTDLHYLPDLGLYYTTKSIYSKFQQIEKNPMATISIYPGTGLNTAVAQVTIRITSDPEIKEAAFYDGMLKYGYSKTNDPYYRVLLITVHSVQFGKDSYIGAPFDPATYDKIAKEDIPRLPSGPFQTSKVDELIKWTFASNKNVHLITKVGLEHDSRIITAIYKEGIGLYVGTNAKSKKIKQIISNANVILLTEDKEKWIQVVVDAAAKVSTNPELKKKIWYDGFKKYGFSGPEDDNLALILFTPRRVFHHTQETDCPVVYTAEPVQYDKDLQIMRGLVKHGDCIHLSTADNSGVIHSRIMGSLTYYPVLGFTMSCQAGTAKIDQLNQNSHSILTSTSEDESYTIEAEIVPQTDKHVLYFTWNPKLSAFGYKSPDDASRVILQINVTKAEYVNIKEVYSRLDKK